jgi:hypothetical protein
MSHLELRAYLLYLYQSGFLLLVQLRFILQSA